MIYFALMYRYTTRFKSETKLQLLINFSKMDRYLKSVTSRTQEHAVTPIETNRHKVKSFEGNLSTLMSKCQNIGNFQMINQVTKQTSQKMEE